MNCPADAIECGPLVDPAVRIEQLVQLQRKRDEGRDLPFGLDLELEILSAEQALFLVARGHWPKAITRDAPTIWIFWAAAQGELPDYWAAHRLCTGLRRNGGRSFREPGGYLARIRSLPSYKGAR